MARPNFEKIEIVEPPIQELSKNRSSFRRTCLTGCGCVVFFLIFIIVGLWFIIGPGPKTVKTTPANFPTDVPIYDRDNIEQITIISGRYRSRGVAIAGFFPKIILSPLLVRGNVGIDEGAETAATPTTRWEYLKRVWQLLVSPAPDKRDSVQIEWQKLDAEPSFIISYYKKELRKSGYTIDQENQGTKRVLFHKDSIDGIIAVTGDEESRPGTDYVVMTVNLP